MRGTVVPARIPNSRKHRTTAEDCLPRGVLSSARSPGTAKLPLDLSPRVLLSLKPQILRASQRSAPLPESTSTSKRRVAILGPHESHVHHSAIMDHPHRADAVSLHVVLLGMAVADAYTEASIAPAG
jgi:hypothetical protein